jgi:hypothetical protein
VRFSGRAFEALAARNAHRTPRPLFHSALEVVLGDQRFVIEMAPVWSTDEAGRGVVSEGPVGLSLLGRSRLFRYEVRCWADGCIPDAEQAIDSPQRVSADVVTAARVLELVPSFPNGTWGRDEFGTGDMWNSNSLISWLLALSGHEMAGLMPPDDGRAPGWNAGLAVARRHERGMRTSIG